MNLLRHLEPLVLLDIASTSIATNLKGPKPPPFQCTHMEHKTDVLDDKVIRSTQGGYQGYPVKLDGSSN